MKTDEVISNDLEILANVLNINEIENFEFSETEHLNDQTIQIPKWEKVKENNFVYLFYLKFNIYNISLRYPGIIYKLHGKVYQNLLIVY